ncbi:I78 family peptidase inhibitor [Pseudoroseicyclus sp. H15]
MRLSGGVALAAVLALGACAGQMPAPLAPAAPSLPPPDQDSCRAAGYAGLIGREREALERVLILGPVRVIDPGDTITEEFFAERINFYIEGVGPPGAARIARIACG